MLKKNHKNHFWKKYIKQSPYILKIMLSITNYIACNNAEISEKYYTATIMLFIKIRTICLMLVELLKGGFSHLKLSQTYVYIYIVFRKLTH